MLILDTTQMPNARGGYWFVGKFTTDGSGVGIVDILCNKDLTRYLVSFFSAVDPTSPGSYTKVYSYSEANKTFTITVTLLDALAAPIASTVTDYFIYVSTVELITQSHYDNGDVNLISENLLNPKV